MIFWYSLDSSTICPSPEITPEIAPVMLDANPVIADADKLALSISPKLDDFFPASSIESPSSSAALSVLSSAEVVCLSWLSSWLSSVSARATDCRHLSVLVSLSPHSCVAFWSACCNWLSFCFCASIAFPSISCCLAALPTASASSSADVDTAFNSAPNVLTCCVKLFNSFRNSASPSIPIRGPISAAI